MRQLHDKLMKALTDRSIWEQRQAVWYQMRHDGLRRKHKPFPGASDLHFPLIDTMIEKLKPFYFQQIFGQERLAFFQHRQQQNSEVTESAAEYFDTTLKEETNFTDEALSMLDTMLLTGRGILKVIWDPFEGRLVYESVEPLWLIVPRSAKDLESADYFAHIKHVTVDEYKRDRRYVQDPELIKRIAGRPNAEDQGSYEENRASREGLTYATDEDVIVIWEGYEKTANGWTIRTFSPNAPDVPLRKPFGSPLKWRGKALLNFASFSMEVKEKGWYAPRGVAERMAAFEASCCKMWNEKHDWMSFWTKPLFTQTMEIPNTGNFRFQPGEVLPRGITPAVMPAAPPSLDEELLKTRQIAEENLMIPDFGIGDQENDGEKRTATEVQYIQAFASSGVDMRGKVFRAGLGQSYRISWAMLVRHGQPEMVYWLAGDMKVLPPQALHDQYLVQPEGNPDTWNKQQRLQRTVGRFQMFAGDPFVNQAELRKDVIAADDARDIKRLFMDPGMAAANEAEDEAMEVLLLMSGYPAQAEPHENHQLRLQVLLGKLEQLGQLGEPVDPVAKQRLHEHIRQHHQMLMEQNPQVARQIEQALTRGSSTAEQVAHNHPAGGSTPPPATNPVGAPAPAMQTGGMQ